MKYVPRWAPGVIYFTFVRLALSIWLLGTVLGALFTLGALAFDAAAGGSSALARAGKRLALLIAWPLVLMTRTGRETFRAAFKGEL